MSFVPAPQQANAAIPAINNGVTATSSTNAATRVSASAGTDVDLNELMFKLRTFDVYWIEKKALMYKDGIAKVG